MRNENHTYIVRFGDIDENVDGERYLSRTVFETDELTYIGIKDKEGNKIMAKRKKNPIGFVWHKEI